MANITDCPTTCESGRELCETGLCLEDCDSETNAVENPCGCETLPLACPKVVDTLEVCVERFDAFYTANNECLEAQEDALPLVDFTGPYFVACYSWLAIVTALTVLWCAFNTYVPVEGARTEMTTSSGSPSQTWTLTGYEYHPVGVVMYTLVILTLLGFQFLLFVLTIFYYMQQEAITRWEPVFYDEVQVLMAFEIVWMVGIVWSFAFRYPSSIRDLFLRQCALSSASFVAVLAPIKRVEAAQDEIPGFGERVMAAFYLPVDGFLRLVFSYPYNLPGYETVFCPVETDVVTGNRGFYFRMRRFVYSGDASAFQPGTVEVGKTLGDFLGQDQGLTTNEAKKRFGLTGPNIIPMKKPSVLGSIFREFAQPFYLYQNYMVWSWAP